MTQQHEHDWLIVLAACNCGAQFHCALPDSVLMISVRKQIARNLAPDKEASKSYTPATANRTLAGPHA